MKYMYKHIYMCSILSQSLNNIPRTTFNYFGYKIHNKEGVTYFGTFVVYMSSDYTACTKMLAITAFVIYTTG